MCCMHHVRAPPSFICTGHVWLTSDTATVQMERKLQVLSLQVVLHLVLLIFLLNVHMGSQLAPKRITVLNSSEKGEN